jgi:hypothetical protein
MIDQGLVDRLTRLPARQRLELIEALTRSLHGELPAETQALGSAPAPGGPGATGAAIEELAAIERLARSFNLDVPPDSSLHQLRGVAANGAVPMAKDEVREIIADYLIEKPAT